jgi:hypothetical protein
MGLEDPLLFGFGESSVEREYLDRVVQSALGQVTAESFARIAYISFGGEKGEDISASFAEEFIDGTAESFEERVV